MKTYKELKTEFDHKVARLQKHCPHEQTEWLYSVGLGGGGKVKVCLRCEKVLARKDMSKVSSTTKVYTGVAPKPTGAWDYTS